MGHDRGIPITVEPRQLVVAGEARPSFDPVSGVIFLKGIPYENRNLLTAWSR